MYMDSIFETKLFKTVVNRVAKKVLKLREKLGFEAIACRGVSGSAVAFAVSYITNIPVIFVRKSSEKSHGNKIEVGLYKGNCPTTYLIIDDFIDTGTTVNEIYKQLSELKFDSIACVGILLYDEHIQRKNFKVDNKIVDVYRTKPVNSD